MLEQLVDIISDTSFLIHLATHRITNIDSIETEIGNLSFVVPEIVKKELDHLAEDPDKNTNCNCKLLNILKILKQIQLQAKQLISEF